MVERPYAIARPRSNSFSAQGRASYPQLEPLSNAPSLTSTPNASPPSSHRHLPPGLSLPPSAERDYEFRDDFETLASGSSGSRKSSSSSESGSTAASSITSLGLIVGGKDQSNGGRGWLEGEDPALQAARRALWDDSTVSPPSLDEQAEAIDDSEDDGEEEDDDSIHLPPVPSPSCPSHATLPPLPSILRAHSTPPVRSRASSTSLSTIRSSSLPPSSPPRSTSPPTTTASVKFSSDPPPIAVTYSPLDYSRVAAVPVEKLSVKEWVELRGVKEAVGVWSGKISLESSAPPALALEDPGARSRTSSLSSSIGWTSPASPHHHLHPSLSLSSTSESRGEAGGTLERKTSCASLAALKGIRSVGSVRTGQPCGLGVNTSSL